MYGKAYSDAASTERPTVTMYGKAYSDAVSTEGPTVTQSVQKGLQ